VGEKSVLPPPEEYAELAPKPGSPVWRAFNDVRLLGTSGYATLLQVAHPTVGHGVHQYSSFLKDPWGRLFRTLDYVHGTIYGGPELAGEIGARVRNMHKTIKGEKPDGTRYHAMEPDAFAWVHATLAASIFTGHEKLAKPMTPGEREAFWQEWLGVGRLVGVREGDLPDDVRGFEEYFDRVVHRELEWTPAVPEVLSTFKGAGPPPLDWVPPGLWRVIMAPGLRQLRLTTVALVPEALRERLDLPFSPAERRAWDVIAAASRASGPLVRGPLRNFGPNYVRWRREALARGDVAREGSAPAPRPAAA
jgi:uncharacterized protein (DUF2236 family)